MYNDTVLWPHLCNCGGSLQNLVFLAVAIIFVLATARVLRGLAARLGEAIPIQPSLLTLTTQRRMQRAAATLAISGMLLSACYPAGSAAVEVNSSQAAALNTRLTAVAGAAPRGTLQPAPCTHRSE